MENNQLLCGCEMDNIAIFALEITLSVLLSLKRFCFERSLFTIFWLA